MAIIFDGSRTSLARLQAAAPGGSRLLALGFGHLAALRDRGLGLAALFASAVEISRAVERAPSNRQRELGSAWMWTELGGNS